MDHELKTELLPPDSRWMWQVLDRHCMCSRWMAWRNERGKMTSWPPSWEYDVLSEIQLCQSMRSYLKNNCARSDLKPLALNIIQVADASVDLIQNYWTLVPLEYALVASWLQRKDSIISWPIRSPWTRRFGIRLKSITLFWRGLPQQEEEQDE